MPASAQTLLNCPNCGAPFPHDAASLAALGECPGCARATQVVVFPAFEKPPATATLAETVVAEGEATCFYHPQKRAHIPCDGCGRFLCAMCDLDLGGQHLCPQCLETGAKKGKLQSLERNRTRWDQIVSTLLILPVIFCYFALPITSLAALILIGWRWKTPGSLVSNSRVRFIVYAIVAALEFLGSIVAWGIMIFRPNLF
jgi:ribosomal protein S27E